MQRLRTQADWIARAREVLPAPGFGNVDPGIVISHGTGSRVWDEDGNEYVDYLIGSGPMVLGHGHPEMIEAVLEQLPRGMTFFANNAKGIARAAAIVVAVPQCKQVRFFAVIVEPVQRIIPAASGFLDGLRSLCTRHDVLLIFDEIVTGFRLAYGGAQKRYGITPDICTLGKIGGGFPLAALGASSDIMARFDKTLSGRWLMRLGTLSGNTVASAAGLKTMEVLRREGAYDRLPGIGGRLQQMLRTALNYAGILDRICGDETLFDIFFTDRDYRSARYDDPARNARCNEVLRANGIFKSPGKLYPSLAIDDADLETTQAAIRRAVAAIA